MLDIIGKFAVVATAAFMAFPVVIGVFWVFLIRTDRQEALLPMVSRSGRWLLGVIGAGFLLFLAGAFLQLPLLGWGALGLLAAGLVLCGWLVWKVKVRPLQGIIRALFADLLLLVLFLPLALWISGEALREGAYSNPDERTVRTALAKNPNDPAAHSSLAQIEMIRGDHAGEIAEWQQVLRLEPNNQDALFLLGARLSQKGQVNEARPLYQKLAVGNGSYANSARLWLAKHGTQ